MFKFTIRELLLLTMWVAVFCAILLAIGQVYETDLHPWFTDRGKVWRLTFLHLGAGTALGGIVGFLRHSPWRCPLIGLALGLVAEVCWNLWLANAASGLA